MLLFQNRNIPFICGGFSIGSSDVASVESTAFVEALVIDRVERVIGGGAIFFDVFFPLAMVVSWGEEKFCFPPIFVEFLCCVIPFGTAFLLFSPRLLIFLFDTNDHSNGEMLRMWSKICTQRFFKPPLAFP